MRLARLQCAVLAAAVLIALGAAGCGGVKTDEQGVVQPAREGLGVPLNGVDYNVFITRELNLRITPDEAYYQGPEPKPGFTYYGIFIQACNKSTVPRQTIREFRVTDNQETEFEPVPVSPDNAFGYTPRKLAPQQCIPEAGSVAQQGPTAGSMLLFDFPLATTENRPLELELRGPYDLLKAKRQIKKVELDL
jgi:hypothetical protein